MNLEAVVVAIALDRHRPRVLLTGFVKFSSFVVSPRKGDLRAAGAASHSANIQFLRSHRLTLLFAPRTSESLRRRMVQVMLKRVTELGPELEQTEAPLKIRLIEQAEKPLANQPGQAGTILINLSRTATFTDPRQSVFRPKRRFAGT